MTSRRKRTPVTRQSRPSHPDSIAARRRAFGPFLLPVAPKQRNTPLDVRRLNIFTAVVVVVALVFGWQLTHLQLLNGQENRRAAKAMTTRTSPVPAQRGRVLAADGSVLAGNGASTTITADPAVLAQQADGGRALLTKVARALGRDPQAVLDRAKPCGSSGAPAAPICNSRASYLPIPVVLNVPLDKALRIMERPEAYRGISMTTSPIRTYPASGKPYAQLLGYLGADETGAMRGRSGLEQQYDSVLRGKDGQRVYALGPDGLVRGQVSSTQATTGLDVKTSIDPTIQKAADAALAKGITRARATKHPADSGSVVVLDAQTGQVAAMSNQPTYDPSVWNGGISQKEYDKLFDAASSDPLAARAATVAGPPASTFKVFSLFAAAESGVDPTKKYSCPSAFVVGNRAFHNFESAAYGQIDVPRILEVSCDTIFYRWAYKNWIDAGGMKAPIDAADPFVDVARRFGMGSRTGIDLPAEAAGTIPDRKSTQAQWLKNRASLCARAKKGYPEIKDKAKATYLKQVAEENCKTGGVLRAGDAVNFAIGQGDVAVTPIQLAMGYAALANGGRLMQPRLATAYLRADGTVERQLSPVVRAKIQMDPTMLAKEMDGLRRATLSGTARNAFLGFDTGAYPVYGKTGTAEVYGNDATAWFASFGPKRGGRQYVVVVRVDAGGEGGKTAAPIAREVWDTIVKTQ